MHCFACGERLEEGSAFCPRCGSSALPGRPPFRRCPRCGYRGEGVGYFRRPGHVGLLVLFGILTYGIGSLIHWLVRRHDAICPSCGLRWSRGGDERLGIAGDTESLGIEAGALPPGGGARRVLGAAALLAALVLVTLVAVGGRTELIAVAGATAVAGGGSIWWGIRALRERRRALLTACEQRVLHLAAARGGVLTATEVAAGLNLTLPAAERILISMDDGFRVRSEITEEGLLLYQFPELVPREERSAGHGRGPGDAGYG